MDNTDLYEKIIARCDKDNLPLDHELRLKALAFNTCAKIILDDEVNPEDFKMFLSSWAKARLAWCKYSEESLI